MNIIAIAAAQASLSDAQYVVDGRKHNAAMKADVVASLQKVGYSRPARGRTDSRLR